MGGHEGGQTEGEQVCHPGVLTRGAFSLTPYLCVTGQQTPGIQALSPRGPERPGACLRTHSMLQTWAGSGLQVPGMSPLRVWEQGHRGDGLGCPQLQDGEGQNATRRGPGWGHGPACCMVWGAGKGPSE